MNDDDARLRALINDAKRNERSNPAVAADVQHRPSAWTPEQERELVEQTHGDERERIDRLVAEYNEQQRNR
ncbi:hypothetical protein KEC56_12610 [Microbacterium sp. YMB-B2]|uniref:Uncharacterized protein n=1 Tax=Microbacterium tenebrionis TaxID=2830665 RepID=A0A9X1S1Y9_9MICO|nr:hypothetical protein [Microbacterium tenebrionis]MCC2030343.1 hypothetical protein [Microbacterium tenebrionis]